MSAVALNDGGHVLGNDQLRCCGPITHAPLLQHDRAHIERGADRL